MFITFWLCFISSFLFFKMISMLKRNNWLLAKIVIFITVAIPLGITAYELTIGGKESVIFLGDYPPALSIIVIIYYAILLVAGIIWVIMQLKAVLRLKHENTKERVTPFAESSKPTLLF